MGEIMDKLKIASLMGLEPMNEQEIRMMNPIQQAYLGDAVYELYVRTYILHTMKGSVNELNKKAVQYVKATSQAKMVYGLESFLTDDEKARIRRGRNQKSISVPKNASMSDYRYATGFEAMIGWLYLNGDVERIGEIVRAGIACLDELAAQSEGK